MDTPNAPVLDPIIETHLGEKLRSAYSDVLTEPIPKRFLDLLDELAAQEDAS